MKILTAAVLIITLLCIIDSAYSRDTVWYDIGQEVYVDWDCNVGMKALKSQCADNTFYVDSYERKDGKVIYSIISGVEYLCYLVNVPQMCLLDVGTSLDDGNSKSGEDDNGSLPEEDFKVKL